MSDENKLLLSLVMQDTINHFDRVKMVIDGQEIIRPITLRVMEDDFIKVYAEIEDEPAGIVERAILLDKYDRALHVKEVNFDKGYDGWHVAFKFKFAITEEGA